MNMDISHPLLEFPPNVVTTLREKYNLDKGRMEQSVNILDHWVKKQRHFNNKNFSPHYLEMAIISCKGSVEKAKKQLDKLCTLRTIMPKFFIDTDVKSKFDLINQHAYVVVLPKMTKDNQRVFILKINEKEFDSSYYLEYYRCALILSEYLKAHDYTDGFVIIEDFRDVNMVDLATKINLIDLQHLVTILIAYSEMDRLTLKTPVASTSFYRKSFTAKAVQLWNELPLSIKKAQTLDTFKNQEGYGARMKGIHLLSQSKMIEMLIKSIKPVLPEKIAERIHVHQGPEDVYDIIDKAILPSDFGGKERSLKELQAEWTKLLCSEEHEEYLKLMKSSYTDESQRDTDKFNEQYMGMPGSFRTLTVD